MAACYAVASDGNLPADKASLDACLSLLFEPQRQTFKTTQAALNLIHEFSLTQEIGTWVGNVCSLLHDGGHWKTAADLSALPAGEKKPIWMPYLDALKAVNFHGT
jgi:hypothetical protein